MSNVNTRRPVRGIVSPIDLEDIYAHLGDYSVKMIIDPAVSPSLDLVQVDVRNSDGRPMEFISKRWGTKLSINFKIDQGTPDGVSVIDVTMSGRTRKLVRERFSFWVVK